MPTTAKEFVAFAAREIGYTENPPGSNRTKYGKWYGMDGQPWCAMYVSWVANKSGNNTIIPKHAYTVSGAKWFYDRGQWVERGYRTGDIVYFAFNGPKFGGRWKGIHHVGIVESVRPDGMLVTIEGNTSRRSADNGGAVMRMVRNPANVAGAGRPKYDKPLPKPKKPS